MSEKEISYLYKAVSCLRGKGDVYNILRSHYLTKCKTVRNNGKGLPAQHFGPRKICSYCSCEWKGCGFTTKVLSCRNGSKNARRKIRKNADRKQDDSVKIKNENLNSNALERKCNFCGHKTVICCLKPSRKEFIKLVNPTPSKPDLDSNFVNNVLEKPAMEAKRIQHQTSEAFKLGLKSQKVKTGEKKIILSKTVDVYRNSNTVFTMKAPIKQNLEQAIPRKKNSKKKDKFAGLCKEAVLSSAKNKQNNACQLGLFLKPSE